MLDHLMTKEEAEAKVAESMEEALKLFCPLIGGGCIANCAGFSKGYTFRHTFNQNDDSKYQFHPAGCCSPLITGNVELDQ